LAAEPMMVLCHPTHPLAARGTRSTDRAGDAHDGRGSRGSRDKDADDTTGITDLSTLGKEAVVVFHPDCGRRMATDAAFTSARVRRTVTLEVNDVHSLLELVQEGLGIAVVPRHFSRKPHAAGLVAIPLRTPVQGGYATVAVLPQQPATSPA